MAGLDAGQIPMPSKSGAGRFHAGMAGLLWLAFALLMLFVACQRPFDYDSGFFSSAAKSLALGGGYASHYHVRQWLDPLFSTGPALVVPLAAAIRVWGNAAWLPFVQNALVHVALLGFWLWALFRVFPERRALALSVAFVVLWLVYEPRWWVVFTADMQMLLLLLLLAWLLVDEQLPSTRRWLGLGVLMAWVWQAKVLSVIGLAVVAVVLMRQCWVAGRWRWLLWCLLGFFLLWLPLQALVWQAQAQMTPTELATWKALKWQDLMDRPSSGVGLLLQAESKWAHLLLSLQRSTLVVSKHLAQYGFPVWVVFLLLAGTVLMGVRSLAALFSCRPIKLSWVLAWMAMAYLAWYFLFCFALAPKFAYLPIMLSMAAVLVWLAERHAVLPVLALAMLLLVLPTAKWQELAGFYVPESDGFAGYREDSRDLVDYLQANPPARPLAGCSWYAAPRTLEYLLPGVQAFRDCYQQVGEAIQSGWTYPADATVIVDKRLMIFDRRNRLRHEKLYQACGQHVLYENLSYALLECRTADWQRVVTGSEHLFPVRSPQVSSQLAEHDLPGVP